MSHFPLLSDRVKHGIPEAVHRLKAYGKDDWVMGRLCKGHGQAWVT